MRVHQSSCFLTSLLKDVANGVVSPAAMQRPYVWEKADVEALCASILDKFPIGSFLNWAPGNKADLSVISKGRLGPVLATGEDIAFSPTQLLLDGQNRLASLAWMMAKEFKADEKFPPSAIEAATWLGDERLVLDYETRSMIFVPSSEASDKLRVPAWAVLPPLGQDHSNMRYLRECWNKWEAAGISEAEITGAMKFIDKCTDAFRDARTTITFIEDATVEEARSAFLRICRTGVQMSQEDFDNAVSWVAGAA